MVGVAQLVEHLVVAQAVVGSSPITHPSEVLIVRIAGILTYTISGPIV